MEPIIKSLLDLDLYKLTVQQIAYNRFGNIEAEYEFTCRNKDKVDLLGNVGYHALMDQLESLNSLKLTEDEYEWLSRQGYFQETYLQYLRNFRFNTKKHLTVELDKENRTYKITVKGPWVSIILYETLVLSIVNELFGQGYVGNAVLEAFTEGAYNLQGKIAKIEEYNKECRARGIQPPKFIEFGTRRRFSAEWQSYVVQWLQSLAPDNLVGTSNVHLARTMNLKPIGTFGHEFPMAMQGIYPVQKSQRMAFRIWLQEYNGLWGTALGDTLGDEKFFKDFTFDLAKGYDGVRHDSGDPFVYGERIIKMYEDYGIDPLTKKIVFSDGLDVELMIKLHQAFQGRIQVLFGIGTNLTNDVGVPVLHIVMKIIRSNGQDVCKLSANPEKASCKNPLYLEYTKMAIENY